jgi:hypothetical protein
MTVLKTITLKGKQIEQKYFGGQDIQYKVDGVEYTHEKFWKSPFIVENHSEVNQKLNDWSSD